MEREWVHPHAFLSDRAGRAGGGDLAIRRVVLPQLPPRRPRQHPHDFVSGYGLTNAALDAASNSVFFLAYDAFGNPLNYDPATTFDDHLYSGEQTDSTGLQYLRSRYYDPATGRMLSDDDYRGNPQDPQSLHKYLYCWANPVNGVDPTGMFIDLGGLAFQVTVGVKLASAAFNTYCGVQDFLHGVEAIYGGDSLGAAVNFLSGSMSLAFAAIDFRSAYSTSGRWHGLCGQPSRWPWAVGVSLPPGRGGRASCRAAASSAPDRRFLIPPSHSPWRAFSSACAHAILIFRERLL